MTAQLTLDQLAAARNIDRPGLRIGRHLSLSERYQEWRATADGQAVYAHIRREALWLRERGRSHYAIATLWEVARHHFTAQLATDAGFRLNNDYRSLLAREVMASHPELAGFFETRELRAV